MRKSDLLELQTFRDPLPKLLLRDGKGDDQGAFKEGFYCKRVVFQEGEHLKPVGFACFRDKIRCRVSGG
jgi:hypothetical protein